MTLKELEVGDIFVNVKSPQIKFIVRGNPAFNIGYGSPTRICSNLKTKNLESKACKIEVKKLGESKFKEEYKLKPINKI